MRVSIPLPRGAARAAAYVAVLALAACSSPSVCEPAPPDPACPDLRFGGRLYDEWRETRLPRVVEELGDGTYPACTEKQDCGPDLDGRGATDVWRLEGVDPKVALIGHRRGTETPVVFVRRGLDPTAVPGLPHNGP